MGILAHHFSIKNHIKQPQKYCLPNRNIIVRIELRTGK